MRSLSVTEFKAHALEEIESVSQTSEGLILTKRGKPIAQLAPYREISRKPVPGKLSGYLVFEKDIVSPLGAAMWKASR